MMHELKSLLCWHDRHQYDVIELPGVTSSGRQITYRTLPRTMHFAQCLKCGKITHVTRQDYNSLPPPPSGSGEE